MQFLKNIFAPIGAVLGFINKYFKSLIFLLILFLIFASGESAQQRGANLAQLSLNGAIMDDSEILEKIETLKNDEAIKGVLLLIDSPGGALSPRGVARMGRGFQTGEWGRGACPAQPGLAVGPRFSQ